MLFQTNLANCTKKETIQKFFQLLKKEEAISDPQQKSAQGLQSKVK
jgi:hypothetical protein